QVDVAIAVHAAVHTRARLERTLIVLAHGLLPLGTPGGSARRDRGTLDGPAVRLDLAHVASAHKPVRSMIEVVAIELIDAHPDGTGGDERVEHESGGIEEAAHIGDGLVSKVAADHSAVG